MKKLPILLLLLLAAGNRCMAQNPMTGSTRYAILAYDSAQMGGKSVFSGNVRQASLGKVELAVVGEQVHQAIADYNAGQQAEFEKWQAMDSRIAKEEFFINEDEYLMQYVPIQNEQGEKEVWVNAFCYCAGDKWKRELIHVDGGGKCYFHVIINLTAKKYYNFAVN